MDDDTALTKRTWFHAIELPDGRVTPGRFARDTPPNYTLFGAFDLLPHIDLSNARCFDVGAMDGIASFVMKGLGAREVVTCDMARRDTFLWAREKLGLDGEYRVPVSTLDMPAVVGPGKADLILMAGVLYHVYDPLTVLVALRESLRLDGLLLLETLSLFDEGRPVMSFNPSDRSRRRVDFPHVYWRASKSAVHGMLRLAGFEVVATRMVNARLTVLAQAKRPQDIEAREDLVALAQDHHRHAHYKEAANFDALSAAGDERARVSYRGPRDDRFLYRATFEPRVPHQPRWDPPRSVVLRDLAKSARMHAAMRLGERREQLASDGLERIRGGS